ncbi:MAG: hypothetical protein KIS87_11785 [Phycisphaeraceae bacterium]|nr:hypothetical protein [Phycisphaeraceae bacterium]
MGTQIRRPIAPWSLAACVLAVSAGATLADPPRHTLIYAESSSASLARCAEWDNPWETVSAPPAFGGSIAWMTLHHAPNGRRAAVAVDDYRSLMVSLEGSSSWSDPEEVCADVGTMLTRTWHAGFEGESGDLLIVYRSINQTAIHYRTITAGTISDEQTYSGLNLDAAPRWIELVQRPQSDEMILLAGTSSRLAAAVWNGSSFGSPSTLSTSLPADGKPFAGAYVGESANARVVYGQTGGGKRHRTWNGASWSSAGTISGGSGVVAWMCVARDPSEGSDRLIAVWSTATKRAEASTFNGSNWANVTALDTSMENPMEPRVAAAFTPNGEAVVAWHRSGENRLRSRTWDGSAWTAAVLGPNLGSAPVSVQMISGPGDNQTVAAIRQRSTTPTYEDYLVYSSGGNLSYGSMQVYGLQGAQISGMTLPDPPSGSSGSTNLSYGNNATATIAPGSYRDITAGNGCTLNVSAGDYFFRSMPGVGNNFRFIANTTNGDVNLVFTNGNVNTGNNFEIISNGEGRVYFHLVNGNFQTGNNADVTGHIYVHNGNFQAGNNTNISGRVYASGNFQAGNNNVVYDGGQGSAPGPFSTILWTSGSPSSPVIVADELHGVSPRMPFALSAPVEGTVAAAGIPVRVVRWREVNPRDGED